MKHLKSLACLIAVLLVTGCGNKPQKSTVSSSATSSSLNETSASSFFDSSSSASSLSSSSIASPISASSASSSILSSSNNGSSSSQSPSSSAQSSSQSEEKHYYDGYYDALVSWTGGEDLKNQLYDIIRNGYRPLSYDVPNYESNTNADHTKYDFEYLDVVYSKEHVFKNETFKGWQREHAFCASLMCGNTTGVAVKNKGRATDFHNLFASNASANSSRQNKNYGTANVMDANYTNRTTDGGQDGYSFDPTNFEPGNVDKGRLARAIFYMATMYKNDEEDTANGITMKGLKIVERPVEYIQGESGYFAIGNLSTLLSWNRSFNVDYLEMQHNISVYQDVYSVDGYAQGNRNPYVDFPELVDYVYGNKKDQPGSLADLTPSFYINKGEEKIIDHYAIKEAQREYTYGDTVTSSDYRIVKVYNDFTYEETNDGFTHSLNNHTFTDSDGEKMTANIMTEGDSFSYKIDLNPMASCSSGVITLVGTGAVDKTKVNQDQEVTWDNEKFILNMKASLNKGNAFVQSISGGGATFGSGTYPLTDLTIKTKNTYTVDAAYIKAFVGNVDSVYWLTIKVGETTILNQKAVNNKDVGKVYGKSVSVPLTGQITYIFSGSSSLKINTIAFNSIIA